MGVQYPAWIRHGAPWWAALCLAACSPEEVRPDFDDTDDTGTDACSGEVERIEGVSLQIVGQVQTADGSAAEGASLRLRDRVDVPPGDLATDIADVDGTFTLDSNTITAFPGCWAVLSDYVIQVQFGELSAELTVTRKIGEAWIRDEPLVDLGEDPIIVR